jgi:hypothetical protein
MVQSWIEEDSLLGNCGANMRGREPNLRLQGERSDVFTLFCGINTQSESVYKTC